VGIRRDGTVGNRPDLRRSTGGGGAVLDATTPLWLSALLAESAERSSRQLVALVRSEGRRLARGRFTPAANYERHARGPAPLMTASGAERDL